MNETLRFIIGYVMGGTVFLIGIPFGLYELSRIDHYSLIHSAVLRTAIAFPFFLIGVFFAAWSNIFLFMVGKGGPAEGLGIAISPKTKRLVTVGPYRYSRNPMVFGAFMLYVSIAIFCNSIVYVACLVIFLPFGIGYLKFSEEKRLLRDFGDEFREYRKRVPMLFPVRLFGKKVG